MTNGCLRQTLRIAALALSLLTTLAAPAPAHADFNWERFQSPSGDVLCVMLRDHDKWDPASYGKGDAACQVQDPNYEEPPRRFAGSDGQASTCYLGRWGTLFALREGSAPHFDCVGDAFVRPPLPTLEYGQTMSLGSITCASAPLDMTCTDASTGHFFRVSRDAYEFG